MAASFFDRVATRQRELGTRLCLGLDPRDDFLSDADRASASPLAAWGERLLRACAPAICCVKPNSGFYEAHGAAGIEALAATIRVAHELDVPVLLDAKRGDIGSTAAAYARAAFEVLGADAITLSPYLGHDGVAPFLEYPGRAVFVLCHTSNPSAGQLQQLEVDGEPLYTEVARLASGWGPRAGLVVGATYPAAIERVRRLAPGAWLLLPGIGAQGADERAALAAAADHVIVPVSRAIIGADDPATAATRLRDRIESAASAPASGWSNGLSHEATELTRGLVEIGALRFGDFTLASGKPSPVYLDLRLLPSHPRLLALAARAYEGVARGLDFDLIAALPTAGLPLGTALALRSGVPLIYPRTSVKAYGTRRRVEGRYEPGQIALILDDLVSSGGSKLEGAEPLRDAGLIVRDVLVLVDRSGGSAADELAVHGLRLHSVMTLEEMVALLDADGAIPPEDAARVRAYLAGGG